MKSRVYIRSRTDNNDSIYKNTEIDLTKLFNHFMDSSQKKIKMRVLNFGFIWPFDTPLIGANNAPLVPMCLHASFNQIASSFCISAQDNSIINNDIIATLFPTYYKNNKQDFLSYYQSTEPEWINISITHPYVIFYVKTYDNSAIPTITRLNLDTGQNVAGIYNQWFALLEFEIEDN